MMMRAIESAVVIWVVFHALTLSVCTANKAESYTLPLFQIVDINVGETQAVWLSDKTTVSVSLLGVNETRGNVREAVRQASVLIELNGRRVELAVGQYNLPVTVEEFPTGVRQMFSRIDANEDGFVTEEEHTRFRSSRASRQ